MPPAVGIHSVSVALQFALHMGALDRQLHPLEEPVDFVVLMYSVNVILRVIISGLSVYRKNAILT